MITIKDVARESGFSPTTVSVVLNNRPLAVHIPIETKNCIKEVAENLGYQPNLFARSLRSNRSHTVGVVVYDITDPYCAQIARAIENSLYRSGYLPILTDIQNSRSRFRNYLGVLLQRRVEGLMILANPLYLDKKLLSVYEKQKIPTVLLGREFEQDSFSTVSVDNEKGGRAALGHLYTLGHRRIAFLKGPKTITDSGQRWKGMTTFAKERGWEIDPSLVVELKQSNSGNEEGYRLTQELLNRKLPFTGLVAFDDMTAFGAIRALRHSGIEVPKGCSVIGFDDVREAAYYNPTLTTIHQPMEVVGSLGVEIMFEAMKDSLKEKSFTPVHRVVDPKLVVRESTAPASNP